MADTVKWFGHEFQVHQMEPEWNAVAGVYIFTGVQNDNLWHAYYVGKADSFKTRLVPSHEKWAAAKRLGATHVHARVVSQAVPREALETELIQKLQPPLNIQKK
jgi:excinuclease UvrABC nuclease subunit